MKQRLSECFDRGYLATECTGLVDLLVDLLVDRVVGGLVDLLFAGLGAV
jgi:hypothetical protein